MDANVSLRPEMQRDELHCKFLTLKMADTTFFRDLAYVFGAAVVGGGVRTIVRHDETPCV